MTLYDEDRELFERRRPGAIAFAITCFCILLLAAQFTTLALGVADAVLSWYRGATLEVWLYAPFADSPALLGGSLAATAAAAAVVIAIALAWSWRADRAFSTILVAHCGALAILTFGGIVVAFDPDRFSAVAAQTGIQKIIWSAALLGFGLIVAMAIEGRIVEIKARLFNFDTPGRRFGWWGLRLVPGFGVLAAACYLNGYMIGIWAAGAALLATLFVNLARTPRPRYAEPRKPLLREAAPTLLLITVLVIAGSIYTFGFEGAGRPAKVVAISPKNRTVQSKLATSPPDKPVIDIRWSKGDGETGRRGGTGKK